MFFYISFLRPPPLQALPSSQIKITPQIANDLRTEHFEGSQDVYFSWSPSSTTKQLPGLQTTKPTKLTTWRQANAYKEMTISPPPGVREGQQWRLILTSDPQNMTIGLPRAEMLGKQPFPVLSMPILFTKQASKGSGKQEQIERVYRFSVLREGVQTEVGMRITEQTSFDLDKVRTKKVQVVGLYADAL
ncbi:hypothetical protein MPER_12884 [Moniliophthora perniciosa FA553]|nr:hypothetical protein MPER_12884 [Moniliophthora perniciosa FA553]